MTGFWWAGAQVWGSGCPENTPAAAICYFGKSVQSAPSILLKGSNLQQQSTVRESEQGCFPPAKKQPAASLSVKEGEPQKRSISQLSEHVEVPVFACPLMSEPRCCFPNDRGGQKEKQKRKKERRPSRAAARFPCHPLRHSLFCVVLAPVNASQ